MLFKRAGFQEEDELVLCTVTNVQFHSVFCDLDEYKNQSGMIHISEVSPGRIRNIRDFVKEDKKIVCLILKINEDKGHIDLSLRRVNEAQKRRKLDSIKQEQKAEKIVEALAKELKKPLQQVYGSISKIILKEYDMLYLAFNEVVEDDLELTSLGIDKDVAKKLTVLIKEKIKPKEVIISGEFRLSSYDKEGLEIVKTALKIADKTDKKLTIAYEGGGRYLMRVLAGDYKTAEHIMNEAKTAIQKHMEEKGGEFAFKRVEK